MFKRIFFIFHKFITFYEHLITLIHQEYNLLLYFNMKFLFILKLKCLY